MLSSSHFSPLISADTSDLLHLNKALTSVYSKGDTANAPKIVVARRLGTGGGSALGALSGIKFPDVSIDFTIELAFRPAPVAQVSFRIDPSRVGVGRESFQNTDPSIKELAGIIEVACKVTESESIHHNPLNVLRVDVQGPDLEPLTFVDLPIPSRPSLDVLAKYFNDEQSVIIALVNPRSPDHFDVNASMIHKSDPLGERSIAVIYDHSHSNISVPDGFRYDWPTRYGWHVLHGGERVEVQPDGRKRYKEILLTIDGFSEASKKDVGIESLRTKIAMAIYNRHWARTLRMVREAEDDLKSKRSHLERLGKPRAHDDEKRIYLLNAASDIQRIVREGVEGRYQDPFFGNFEDDKGRRLRTTLQRLSEVFDYVVRTKGSNIIVEGTGQHDADELPVSLQNTLELYASELSEPQVIQAQELMAQMDPFSAYRSIGPLGSVGDDVLMQLLRRRVSPWGAMAQSHIERVLFAVQSFTDKVFEHVLGLQWSDPTTRAIVTAFVDPFFDEMGTMLQDKLEEMIEPYERGYARPGVFELQQALEEHRASHIEPETREGGDPETQSFLRVVNAFYEISCRNFTSNVTNLVIERCLVRKLTDIITVGHVGLLSAERLRELVAESQESQKQRRQLEEEIKALSEEIKVWVDALARHRRRKPREESSWYSASCQ
ncbi:uncharacterized protein F5Z01DRAFT_622113 [Emericellopsis atlantica]|uniref:GED domain-containing protein n=1 Tax=Emericellopsis atlantica TaxID=2614577 RepID=A0A9P8CPA1_9HYPO|nr:uncharacterized protein F5Z01DRAFT_622113 [Emericellopsis atlantica]KAG9254323.1 hypothetical protein F5Z01DRAFT_622113 [Emericellopsis atlantica]